MKFRRYVKIFFFRKKYLSWSNEKKVRMLENNVFSAWLLICVTLIAVFSIVFYSNYQFLYRETYPEIVYDNLTHEQRVHASNLIEMTKPLYLHGNKKIIFTTDVKSKTDFITRRIMEDRVVYGANALNGVIIVKYSEDMEEMARTLCHELLHSPMKRNPQAHEFVYDIENYLTCIIPDDGETANP